MPAQRKFLITFFITSAIFLYSSKVALAQNLLQNPGFEDGINNWSFTPSTATFSATPSFRHGGDYGAIITKENASSWAYFSQRVAIEADRYYQFSGWVLLNDNAITNVKLRFYWLDASEAKISPTPVEIELREKNSSFQFLQTEPTLSPQNAQFVEVQGYVYLNQKNPPNPAIFDDLVFEEVSLPSPTSTPEPTNTPTPTSPPANPTSTPTPTSKPPTPTPTKKVALTPTPTEKVATESGEILGEEASPAGFYSLEATAEAEEEKEAGPSGKKALLGKIFLGLGFLALFGAAFSLWYTKFR